jgi:hypothetical protein
MTYNFPTTDNNEIATSVGGFWKLPHCQTCEMRLFQVCVLFKHTLFVKITNNWDLASSAMLRSVNWELVSDISAQHISPIFKGQAVQEDFDCLAFEDETDRLFRKVGNYHCVKKNQLDAQLILSIFFTVVPRIFSKVRVLLPNNALLIRHKMLKFTLKYYTVAPTYFGFLWSSSGSFSLNLAEVTLFFCRSHQ